MLKYNARIPKYILIIVAVIVSGYLMINGISTLENSSVNAREKAQVKYKNAALAIRNSYIDDLDRSLKTVGTIKAGIGGVGLILSGVAIYQSVKPKHQQ